MNTTTLQVTFISKESRQSFTVIGADRKDALDTAFLLADETDMPRAVVCKPVHFSREPKPCVL